MDTSESEAIYFNDALQFELTKIPNLYTFNPPNFAFKYVEKDPNLFKREPLIAEVHA